MTEDVFSIRCCNLLIFVIYTKAVIAKIASDNHLTFLRQYHEMCVACIYYLPLVEAPYELLYMGFSNVEPSILEYAYVL